jgi:sugar phosphate isomerase/epimerase
VVELPPIGLSCANLLQVSLPDLIDIAARNGFRRITARPWAFADSLRQGLTGSELRGRLANAGVEVTMIEALSQSLPGVRSAEALDPATRARMPPDVLDPPSEETCFRAAVVLGTSLINVAHYLGEPVPLEAMAEALAGIARRAADHGLRLAVEFIEDTGLPDLPSTQTVIEACGEPNVSILLDLVHLDRSGGTVEDIGRLRAGAIGAIQVSDRVRPPPGAKDVPFRGRSLPGEGHLPVRELITAALENNPSATVDIEVLNDELAALPPEATAARLAGAVDAWRSSFSATSR